MHLSPHRLTFGVVLAVLLAAAPAAASAGDAETTPREAVVLWRLSALGVSPETAAQVEAVLRDEIARLERFALVAEESLATVVEADPDLAACGSGADCAAAAARAAGAPLAVTGVVSTLGETRSLELRRIDATSGEVAERLSQTWTGGDDSLLEAVRSVTVRLLDPTAFVGRIALTANVDGVRVYLDGDYVGDTPLAPLTVAPGRHVLKLVSADHVDFERFVDVPFGRDVPVVVALADLKVEEFVDARPDRGPISFGLKIGAGSNLSAVHGATGHLEVVYHLPVWNERFSAALEGGAFHAVLDLTLTDAGGNASTLRNRVAAFPVQGQLRFHPLPGYPFSPYFAAGGGVLWIDQRQTQGDRLRWHTRDRLATFVVAAGLSHRLGAGALVFEGRWQHGVLEGPRPTSGPLTGAGLLVGYRLRP